MAKYPSRIVVVDDEINFLDEVSGVIEEISPETEIVRLDTERSFKAWLESDPGDIVDTLFLVDIRMETADSGFSCLRTLMHHPEYKRSIKVVLSSSSDPMDVEKSYENGASFYIEKAFRQEELLGSLRAFLSFYADPNVLTPGTSLSSDEPEKKNREASQRLGAQIVFEISDRDELPRLPVRSFRSFSSWPNFGGALEGHSLFIERQLGNERAEEPISLDEVVKEFFSNVRGANPKVAQSLTEAQRLAFENSEIPEDGLSVIQEYLSQSALSDNWVVTSNSPASDKSILELIENFNTIQYFAENDALTAFGFALQIGACVAIVIVTVGSAKSFVKFVDKGFDYLGNRYFPAPSKIAQGESGNSDAEDE